MSDVVAKTPTQSAAHLVLPAEILHNAMLRAELSPKDLDRLLETPSGTVMNWLQGQIPGPVNLLRVAAALGVDQDEAALRELFAAVVAAYLRRHDAWQKLPPSAAFARAVRGYFTAFKPSDGVSKEAYGRLFQAWSSLLLENVGHSQTVPLESSVIVTLPEPPVIVANEWRTLLEQINSRTIALPDLSWKRFEDLIAHLLETFGWEVTPMGYTKDDGVDIVAVRRVAPGVQFDVLVQCKRYSSSRKVGVETVRELWAVKWEKGFHHEIGRAHV